MKKGRNPCCSKQEMNIGAWSAEEDKLLSEYILSHGEGKWRKVASITGLKRCGKSCRLRWLNYLRPGIKRGNISLDEEDLIIRLHKLLGNRWSLIAGRLPGRTDNEIKNYWNTKLCKKIKKNDHSVHSKQQGKNDDVNTSQLVSPNATLSVTPKTEFQQLESEEKDCNPIEVPEEFYQNNSEGSSLFEGEADLNMFSFDHKNLMLDFEVGELYMSEFFQF